MADRGHELTDELLEDLENRIAEEYAKASREMQKKFRDYMEKFDAEDKIQRSLLEAGEITQAEYGNWRFRHVMMGKRWEAMKNVLAADMEKANEIALRIASGSMADVYCLNADFATYAIEHGAKINTGYTLYNHDAAERLLKSPQQMMPGPSTRKAAQIAADKTMQWNKRRIQSAVLQGILQGESPYKVAERLRGVATMNYNASVRYARTMTTNAQNAGRYDSFRRADKLGVELTIEWQATLDGRTRHEHRMMHGQRREVGEPFILDGVRILYPAQSSGPGSSDIPQSMIWNCRCTLLAWVKGFEGDTVKRSPKMGDMSFEEWHHEKELQQATTSESTKPLNIFGEQIQFSQKMDGPKWDDAKKLIEDLTSEYKTKLKTVDVGARKGAGAVQISGTIMQINNSQPQTVIHEFAHTISMKNQTKFGLYSEGEFWKEIESVRRRYRKTVGDDVARWISAYEHGSGITDEFMAEAFALAVMKERGIKIPPYYGKDFTFADEVLRIIRKYFGR